MTGIRYLEQRDKGNFKYKKKRMPYQKLNLKLKI